MNDYDRQLMEESFTKDSFREYRRIFKELMGRPASTCSCDAGTVYNAIKEKMNNANPIQPEPTIIEEKKQENTDMANKNPVKDATSGKFVKKQEPENLTQKEKDKRFSRTVKQEIYDGHTDLERIRKAYAIISGNENYPNVIAMKRTILGYCE